MCVGVYKCARHLADNLVPATMYIGSFGSSQPDHTIDRCDSFELCSVT